jgi:hypothetical protein
MRLEDILRQQAHYCQHILVEVDRRLPTVLIRDNESGQSGEPAEDRLDVFLQGDDAEEFIDKLDELSEQCPDLDFDIIERAAAYDYAEHITYV